MLKITIKKQLKNPSINKYKKISQITKQIKALDF